jgi:hypothetical protein
MKFEAAVLRKVADILGNDTSASFDYGTLFVKCSEEDSRAIFARLMKDYNNRVEVNKTPAEYAFDFIA